MKVAIVKLSALGDIVHAMVALQFVKATYPDTEIDWLVEHRFAGLPANNPQINRILPVNLKALKRDKSGFFAEFRTLNAYREHRYDWVIDAQGLIKSAIVARWLSANCIGFDSRSIREAWAASLYRQHVACPYDANTIDRNVKVIGALFGLDISPQQIIDKQPFLFFEPASVDLTGYFDKFRVNVLLVVGSTWPSRNYPPERFLSVIAGLSDANILIVRGNPEEEKTAGWLAERSGARVLPSLNLNDLKAAIARADLVIGNDTGPTHMAWGLNRPSLTLFGPTPVSRVYQTRINRVLKSPSKVNPFKLDKNDFSIGLIEPDQVIALARQLLAGG
ncbi:lipopolysaccharide heptosyltransferase I [Methylomonas sp. HYX-M1]|uniref:lipopolysaccharide heptosyltransferase I n=1 Tax=Methylomonas sp. HYX-M1 TaxID=3139307 RepID=UPI00345B883C